MEKETKANELGKEVERLAALESSQGMMDRIGNNAVARGHMSEPQAETYLTAVAGRKLGSFYVNHPSVCDLPPTWPTLRLSRCPATPTRYSAPARVLTPARAERLALSG